jgi:DNA-binding beta-propeller fold protein YncE
MMRLVLPALLFVTLGLGPVTAEAQLALSANDNKVVLVDGVGTVVRNPAVDTVSVIDMRQYPPRLVAEITAPTSVVGPPLSVAITPDESLALVTAAMKIDPSDPTKQIPDNRLSVIDLKASPPQVIATLETGKGPAGLSINRQGNLAIVANRSEGTLSIFTIAGKTVTPVGTLKLGDEKIGASHVAFSPDGKTALVSRDGDDRVSVLSVDGTKVEYTKRDVNAGLRPYGLDISSDGKYAVVANIGRGGGDADTISVMDMQAKPVRVVDTITVGQTPEGIKISPDGKWVGVVVMNGSNKAKTSPFFADNGKLVLFRADGTKLTKVAEAPIGHWSQGVAFSTDGRIILVGNMVEKNLQIFDWNGTTLRDSGHQIKLNGGSAAVRIADK